MILNCQQNRIELVTRPGNHQEDDDKDELSEVVSRLTAESEAAAAAAAASGVGTGRTTDSNSFCLLLVLV